MESSTYGRVTDWNDVIKKEARGLNNVDLGEVQEVNEITVITERGNISKEKFYLPKSIPHGYNGRILLFDIRGRCKAEVYDRTSNHIFIFNRIIKSSRYR
jgi:hypothetical protein